MKNFLNELEANKLLSSRDIPMAISKLCKTAEEAISTAEEIGYPVVMKVLSSDILHKTEAGCVFIGVKNREEAEEIYNKIIKNANKYNPKAKINGVLVQEMAKKGLELIIGMKKDPQFGPVIMFGLGGIYVEVFKDIALRLLPLDEKEIVEMIKETKVYEIIQGARGTKYDIDTVVDTIAKISKLVQENSNIDEIDINPFFLYEKGKKGKGVDALVKVSD